MNRLSLVTCVVMCCLLCHIALGDTSPNGNFDEMHLIPWPKSVETTSNRLAIDADSVIVAADPKLLPLAKILAHEIFLATGLSLKTSDGKGLSGAIILSLAMPTKEDREDTYLLKIGESATIDGTSYRGVALGTVTLLQSLRVESNRVTLPGMTIRDWPQFSYNGAMLDVARKPYSIETLKRCVEVCRFYKIRYLQLHMTDENAWTFPSRAFPQLGSQNFAWAGGEAPSVYQPDDLKALVDFAAARGVTLVPEIEVPGHSGQLRGTLPDIFGYRDTEGKPAPVGVINMVSDDAYAALDTLFGEVSEIFHTSPFIHIGCDEASLGGIETVPDVKEFVKKHNLASSDEIFNHFVLRMHEIVTRRGKRMIVWEGAPLGPKTLPKDILFMPWVGGSTLAGYLVQEGYEVINAPWGVDKPYFDPFRVNGSQLNRGEPLLFGATSILWESDSANAVPYLRLTGALRNEPSYSPDAGRNFDDFLVRIAATDRTLDRLLYGFTIDAEGVLKPDVYQTLTPLFDRAATLTTLSSFPGEQIHYTLDGSEPTNASPTFHASVIVDHTATIKARLFRDDGSSNRETLVREYRRVPAIAHDGVGAIVTVNRENPGYPGPGSKGLSDGFLGAGYDLQHPGWIGWINDGQPVSITVDLRQPQVIRNIGTHCLRSYGGVTIPQHVEFLASEDGQSFRKVADVSAEIGTRHRGWYVAEAERITARYLRLDVYAGGDWTFIDEVTVNGQPVEQNVRHAGVGKPVEVKQAPNAYTAPGIAGLTDGFTSQEPNFLSLEWLGFDGVPLEATLDLEEVIEVTSVGANFLQDVRAGIFVPQTFEVHASIDGREFHKVGQVSHESTQNPRFLHTMTAQLEKVKTRYIKVIARSNGQWLFVDEIVVK
ncbi:MAG: family 20 glycosylhydrolase [Planctomycetaceae bacterium]